MKKRGTYYWKDIPIYITIFLIIFAPKFNKSVFFNPKIVTWIILPILFLPLKRIERNYHKQFHSKLIYQYIMLLVLSAIYYLLRKVLMGESIGFADTRIVQNLWPISSLLCLTVPISLLKKWKYSVNDSIKVLIWIATMQGVICAAMVFFPNLKSIAEELYMNGTDKFDYGSYILRKRIYGIASDYTYGMPIICGQIAAISFFISINGNAKYIFNCLLILLCTVLNGVTGLLVSIGSMVIAIIMSVDWSHIKVHKIALPAMIVIFFNMILSFFREKLPETFRNITNGIDSIFTGSGDVDYLINTRVFFPKGWGILFGDGHTVRGEEANRLGVTHSDIGFVNDFFMGGIIYTVLRYGASLSTILYNSKGILNKYLTISTLYMCLVANWKGQATVCSMIIIFVQYIFLSKIYLED